MKRISKRLAASGALDVVATAVPGMKDILVLGKVKSIEEARAADLDHRRRARGRPRGHVPALGARVCSTRCASVRAQAGAGRRRACSPTRQRCQVMLVTLPEETPVNELVDTAFAIEDRAGVALGPVVVNGCFAPLPVARRRATPTRSPPTRAALDRFVSQREADDLAHAAAFLEERHALQHEQIERLARAAAACRRSSCRSSSTPTSRAAARHRSPTRSRAESSGCDDTASSELVDDRRDRHLLRHRRRRQDDDRGGARARRRTAAAATRASSRSIPRSDSPTRSASSTSPNDPTEIDPAALGDPTRRRRRSSGRLSALMLDTKTTFDLLVTRNAATTDQAQRILDNAFYRNVSGALGGTQEYMAMEKLHELHDEGGLRPHRRRHAADTPRARLPRRAEAADPAARQPRVPAADDADARVPPRRERRGADVPAHGRARRRLRGDRRRRRVLPRVRRDGGGLPRRARRCVRRAARPIRRPRSCSSRSPRRDAMRGGDVLRGAAGGGGPDRCRR